jgi:hypothetical protein
MSRPLTADEAAAALRRCQPIEQFLALLDGTLLYLTANPREERDRETRYYVCKHHVRDEGTDDFGDISEFSPVDDDEYLGEGSEVAEHETAEAAVAEAERHGGGAGQWINYGMAAEDYARLRSAT